MIGPIPVCLECRHYHRTAKGATCNAFPRGIPRHIFEGGERHDEPVVGQQNRIVFEAVEKGGKDG